MFMSSTPTANSKTYNATSDTTNRNIKRNKQSVGHFFPSFLLLTLRPSKHLIDVFDGALAPVGPE